MSSRVLLIDFGSTFTKVAAVDCESAEVIGRAQAPTTVRTDVALGLKEAIDRLVEQTGMTELRSVRRLASSSAAGGLRLVVCGLVPRLTSEAARRAALGAGAKVVGVYSYALSKADVAEMQATAPDILLLSGGTDGGDSAVVLANARALANSALRCPVIVAANRAASDEAAEILVKRDKVVHRADNVMPEFGRLEVDPARRAIRDVFIEHIVKAKGLEEVQKTFERPVIPTPMAVLLGAEVLAKGHDAEKGLGDLVLVDVGGATTDVDSVAKGDPTEPSLVPRGLPEPYAKRTVEGDLGIRYNAANILATAEDAVMEHAGVEAHEDSRRHMTGRVRSLGQEVQTLPVDDEGHRVDTALARTAVEIAVARHAGMVEHVYMPDGDVTVQRGKDLRGVNVVVGTGGILAHGKNPRYVLEGARYSRREPLSLRPRDPKLYVDSMYIFYAAGLLAETAPEVAVRLQKQSLVAV